MAGGNSFKIDINGILGNIESRLLTLRNEVDAALTATALEVVKDARNLPQPTFATEADRRKPHTPNYADKTGNLRASIGFAVYNHGQRVGCNFSGGGDGQQKAEALCEEVAGDYPDKIVCVIVAGESYAAYVESKGYDVITGPLKGMEGKLEQYLTEVIKNTGKK